MVILRKAAASESELAIQGTSSATRQSNGQTIYCFRGSIKTMVTMTKTGRRNKRPRRAATESKRGPARPLAGRRESVHPRGRADDDAFPSHIVSEHGQMPPINFAYRAGSAENMSNGHLLMQKVWSETFTTDSQPSENVSYQPTNLPSTACLYPPTPWLPPCLTTRGLRKTEPRASAEASKRYPSTLIKVGCAQHAVQEGT